MATFKAKSNETRFTLNPIGLTGCSSHLEECRPDEAQARRRRARSGKIVRQNAAAEAPVPFMPYQKLMDSVAQRKKRLSALIYPTIPNLDEGSELPSKAHRKKYLFFKLLMGSKKDTVGLFCHQKRGALLLTSKAAMKTHIPYWVLRPWEMFDIKEMMRSGLIRVITHTARTDPNGWAMKTPSRRHPKGYGYNGKFLPDAPKKVKLRGSEVTGFWSGSTQSCEKLKIEADVRGAWSSDPSHGLKFSTAHNSMDMGNILPETLPWWAAWYVAGYDYVTPEDVLEAAGKRAQELFDKGRKIVVVGGNWNCKRPDDSIRIVAALAEKIRDKGQTPISTDPMWFMHNGKRVYFALLPYIYESPQHRDHPVQCAFLSDEPLYFQRTCAS